jgi:hypothetical protein
MCDQRDDGPEDPLAFIPVAVGAINAENNKLSYGSGRCFSDITFTYGQTGDSAEDIGDVSITIDTEKSQSLLCSDWFFFANTEMYHVESFYLSGKHVLNFKNLSPDSKIDIQKNGLKIFMFCSGYVDTFISVFDTILMFFGGMGSDPNVPVWGSHLIEPVIQANIAFLNETMGYDLRERAIQEYDYDESNLQSGDFITIVRLDGLSPIILLGSGAHASHCTMALRMDGEMYIVESRDGDYWPVHGI